MKFVERGAWFCSLLNMAVEPLAMCYPGLAGGTLRAATASIQNESKRLLISQDFLPQSVTTKHLRRTLRNKGFSKASVTTHRRSRAASRLTFQLVGRGRQRERDGDGGELHHFSPFASPRSSSRVSARDRRLDDGDQKLSRSPVCHSSSSLRRAGGDGGRRRGSCSRSARPRQFTAVQAASCFSHAPGVTSADYSR